LRAPADRSEFALAMDDEADSTELFSRDAESIAPFAVELHGPRRLASTHRIPRRDRPSQARWMLAAGGVIAALSLVSGVALRVPPPPAHALGQPRAPRIVGAHEALMIPTLTAPTKDLIALDDDDAATIPVAALPGSAQPALPHVTARAAAHASRGGLLRVPASVKGVLVDGAPHRVERGLVSLPCGTHTIKAPSRPARTLTVACAGTTTL
jgi:hypothetical protein